MFNIWIFLIFLPRMAIDWWKRCQYMNQISFFPLRDATSGSKTFSARIISSTVTVQPLIEFHFILGLRSSTLGHPKVCIDSRPLLVRVISQLVWKLFVTIWYHYWGRVHSNIELLHSCKTSIDHYPCAQTSQAQCMSHKWCDICPILGPNLEHLTCPWRQTRNNLNQAILLVN